VNNKSENKKKVLLT